MLTNTTCDFNNALVNAEINIRLINAVEVLFILRSCLLMLLTNEPYCKVLPDFLSIFVCFLV